MVALGGLAALAGGCGSEPNPDPERIAFASQIGNDFAIYASDADGSNPVALTAVGGNTEPDWSP